jgi:hypothetical protein
MKTILIDRPIFTEQVSEFVEFDNILIKVKKIIGKGSVEDVIGTVIDIYNVSKIDMYGKTYKFRYLS